MLDESKKVVKGSKQPVIDDCLMKPFALGWTREVVNRIITNNRNLNCDIYYISPSGKKIRSLTEIKSNLTDGLTPECFSFRKQPLGVNASYETIRDARVRRKESDLCNGTAKSQRIMKKAENEKLQSQTGFKRRKLVDSPPTKKPVEKVDTASEPGVSKTTPRETRSSPTDKSKQDSPVEKKTKQGKTYFSQRKANAIAASVNHRPESARRKAVLNKLMAKKQEKATLKAVNNKKVVNKSTKKKESPKLKKVTKGTKAVKAVTPKGKVNSIQKNNRTPLKRQPSRNNKEESREEAEETSETDSVSGAKDLKSIVKKNIGKYREMREQQKLAIKSQLRMKKSKILVDSFKRSRSEPISKNKQKYLKPLEKGWRRELVFRTNCAKAGQQADVYYFHPNGKKLRSCREISENLTHGLTLEYFTFRKEPIGCGEPSEVIRNARSNSKSA
ncbi:hypothetical protein RUM43_011781 [Polyplax serrata]|uniref:MBD domain-containing protein n=1 Tax=Polyplax serrata TaxID=468196 RepID=A0AAN8RZG1_POLSC